MGVGGIGFRSGRAAMGFNLKKMCSALARDTHPAGPSATKPDKGSGTHTTLAPTPSGSNVTPAYA